MTDRELMQQALEALEWCLGGEPCGGEDAVRALRERLAQPEFDSALQSAAMTQTAPKLAQPEQWEQLYPDMGNPLDRMAENARELGLGYEPVQEPVNTIANSEAIPEQISEHSPDCALLQIPPRDCDCGA